MGLHWFAHIIVHHPYIILLAVAVLSAACLVVPFSLRAFPDFSDPQMGFETRGTEISNRIVAWKNLKTATETSGILTVNPKQYLQEKMYEERGKSKKKKKKERKKFVRDTQNYSNIILTKEVLDYPNTTEESSLAILQKLTNQKTKTTDHEFKPEIKGDFFCGPPNEDYIHVVLKSIDGSDLFSLKSIFAMCAIEREFTQVNYYKDFCAVIGPNSEKCCVPWSLGNFIALLRNRTSCLNLNEEDVNWTRALLQNCSEHYHSLNLAPDCEERNDCKAPQECISHNAVYNIMNFLTSTTFLPPNKTSETTLHETMLFLPIACSTKTLPYYHEIENLDLTYHGIEVVAMDFGLKNALFDESLVRDAWLMTSGGLFIMFSMWLYTGSFFLTMMTITAILFSLGIAYFLYTLVFDLRFFPFMNLLAIIVAIGIGADDAFIFGKIWQLAKKEGDSSVVKLMSDTFHQAFFSMFVTCLTTAVAFLASYFSSITAIACFSIFAGTAVMSNYLLMISWFPACVVIYERSCQSTYDLIKSCLMACLQLICCSRCLQPPWSKSKLFVHLGKIWSSRERFLLDAIVHWRFFWLIVLSGLAGASAVVVLYYPKLQLPSNPEFQLFDSSHPFEQYDLTYKHKFWFKRVQRDDMEMWKLPLRFVWGIVPTDNGSHLDPRSTGSLKFDPTFDVSNPESQQWLLKFCRRLRQQPFYQPVLGPLLPNCFIETFVRLMEQRCFDPIDNVDRTPCCEKSKFPYERSVFDKCIIDAIGDLYETPREFFLPGVAGPKFSKEKNATIKVIVIEYDSNYTYSMSYTYMHEFYTQVEDWFRRELEGAPGGMKNGFFISELSFYDLQRELSHGTLLAIAMSMGLALVVLLLATLNILTSLYAITTITCSILVTMAVLVLLGWKLNVLESIAVSTAIGLTVDFSLHYTVHYRMVPDNLKADRVTATRYALGNMTGPALMAAITTGAAGAFMMPSLVLAYIQIGIFLLIVMSVSWVYATFHLGSILAIGGPQNDFGQFEYSKSCFKLKKTSGDTTNRTADARELDSLTKNSVPSLPKQFRRSVSERRTSHGRFTIAEQSPSATSAITIITTEGPDIERC